MTEAEVTRAARKIITLAGGRMYRTHSGRAGGMRHNPAGTLDWVVVLPGRVVFMETKATGEALTSYQLETRLWLRNNGHECYCVDSIESAEAMVKGATG